MSQVSAFSFRYHLLLFLYSGLLLLLTPLLLLLNRRKLSLQHDSLKGRRFAERFGRTPNHFKKKGIHIHCVSIGEINAAAGLIKALIDEYPDTAITLTTSSVTGALHAFNMFNGKDYAQRIQHAYLPIDLPWLMRRFYKSIEPKLALIVEVEIWPNMVAQCDKLNIPVCLVNARMTAKSLSSYRKVAWLFRPTLRKMRYICVQNSNYFENFLAFGVYKKQLKLSRNMKFDLLPDSKDDDLGQQINAYYNLQDRPVLLGASTHDPEEKLLLDAYKKLKEQHNDLALIVVPRHPHRFDEVHQIMKASGYYTQRVSDSNLVDKSINLDAKSIKKAEVECLVVDAMGLLKACYSICDVAFVGGSFAEKGGHNALESALYSKPIVMGPSIFNNPNICQRLQEQNALIVTDTTHDLTETLIHWFEHPELAKLDGERGSKVLLRNAGAVEYTLGIVRQILD